MSETVPDSAPETVPYSGLTPESMLEALESVGLQPDGRLLALNSYENRVYQAGIEEGAPIVVKFYRPGRWTRDAILEEHRFVQALAEAEIPAVPPLQFDGDSLPEYGGFMFAVFPRCPGRVPALEEADTLQWMGRFLGRIHAIGARAPYRHRITLDMESFGRAPRDWLMEHAAIPPELLPAWQAVMEQSLEGVRACYARVGTLATLRLHGDCHAGNVLWIDVDDVTRYGAGTLPGPHFVDFDDSCMGPAVQDLWMLLSGDRAAMTRQLGDILAGYEDFHTFDTRELHLIEALRTLRLIHYSGWLARRWDDPAFKAAFPWFNTARYWQDRILELREQIALMQEPPLAA